MLLTLQGWRGLFSNYCPHWRGFKFIIPLNAFTIIQCTKSSTGGLMKKILFYCLSSVYNLEVVNWANIFWHLINYIKQIHVKVIKQRLKEACMALYRHTHYSFYMKSALCWMTLFHLECFQTLLLHPITQLHCIAKWHMTVIIYNYMKTLTMWPSVLWHCVGTTVPERHAAFTFKHGSVNGKEKLKLILCTS